MNFNLSQHDLAASLFAGLGASIIVFSLKNRGFIRHHNSVSSHLADNFVFYCGAVTVASSFVLFLLR